MTETREVVIVGGGTGGITVASRLVRSNADLNVTIIEPSEKHYYQPLWTLAGAGQVEKEITEKDEAGLIPAGAVWLKTKVQEFRPEANEVVTTSGVRKRYDYLVVATGIQINWNQIPGLVEALGTHAVCSNYSYDHVDCTRDLLRNFQGGTAIFTQPNTPIKCGGAPQKIMYLADDVFRRCGVRERSRIIFAAPGTQIFGVEKYRPALERIIEKKGILTRFQRNLIEVKGPERIAVFENLATGGVETIPYDMMHVTPPMSAPDVVQRSPLANSEGWVDVDKHTLQHNKYPNVFSLGDVSSLPTGKTGAAVRKQAPVLVQNLLAMTQGKELNKGYHGYSSCPLVTARDKVILAEFDYDGNPAETFPFDQSKERKSMYLLKRHLLPQLYWHGMLRGHA